MITIAPTRVLPRTVFSIAFTEAEEERWVKENIIIDTLQWTTPRSFVADKGFVESFISEAHQAGFDYEAYFLPPPQGKMKPCSDTPTTNCPLRLATCLATSARERSNPTIESVGGAESHILAMNRG